MEDENENGKEEKGSSVSYPVGGSGHGGGDGGTSSFVRTTTPYSHRGAGGCYSWGGVNTNGSVSHAAGSVDTEHKVKTGKVLL